VGGELLPGIEKIIDLSGEIVFSDIKDPFQFRQRIGLAVLEAEFNGFFLKLIGDEGVMVTPDVRNLNPLANKKTVKVHGRIGGEYGVLS
ncbi:MAG: hypothetical protein JZU63_12740, partial [Rhodoferax sp.]|nr:hypothetical protein [Rhodoferax sp.]